MNVRSHLSFTYSSRLIVSLSNGPNLLVCLPKYHQIRLILRVSFNWHHIDVIDVMCRYLLLSSSLTRCSLTGIEQWSHLSFIRYQVLDLFVLVCILLYVSVSVKVFVSCWSFSSSTLCMYHLSKDWLIHLDLHLREFVYLCICALVVCVCVFFICE